MRLREEVRGTLFASPDNESHREINQVIHGKCRREGQVDEHEYTHRVLVSAAGDHGSRSAVGRAIRSGDVVRYTRGSKTHGIEAGEYAPCRARDAKRNLVTVKRANGEQVSYDPRRLQGVTLYRETERAFQCRRPRAVHSAVQRAARCESRAGHHREDGRGGNLQLRMDSGCSVAFNVKEHPHLDHGYAVTSHSSQGQTADRVLVHVDTEQAGEKLVNRRLAYVAVSRGRYDAQIYTNDKSNLTEQLSPRDVSHRSAMQPNKRSRARGCTTDRAVKFVESGNTADNRARSYNWLVSVHSSTPETSRQSRLTQMIEVNY